MGQSREKSFEEVALRNGWVTEAQVTECVKLQKKATEIGLKEDIAEIFVKKGYLNKQQIQAIYVAQGKGTRAAIEGYEILTKIGQGGMGAVYKARQIMMDRVVAIKVLLPKYAKEKDSRERFLREARAVAHLNHPNIVSGIDAGVSNNIYYYVMEYVEGTPLDKILEEKIELAEAEATKIILQVARALEHAQQHDIIHRDIKPANIIVTKDGTVKLTDLGLARFVSDTDAFMTQTGIVIGTPHYLSPEQALGEKHLDIQSDIYSLGITFYELVTGKLPFTGESSAVIISQRLSHDVTFPPELVKTLSANIRAVIRKMTEREKGGRYKTPNELIEDLEAMTAGNQPLIAKPTVRVMQTQAAKHLWTPFLKKPAAIGAIAAGALILLLAIVFSSKRANQTQKEEHVAEQTTVKEDKKVPDEVVNVKPVEQKANAPALMDAGESDTDRWYAETKEFIEKNAENPDIVLAKLDAMKESLANSNYAKWLNDRYKDFEIKLIVQIGEEVKSAKENVDRLLNQHQYGRAINTFPNYMPKKSSNRGIKFREQKIQEFENYAADIADREATKLFIDADKLIGEKKYGEARSKIESVMSFAVPNLEKRAQDELKKINVAIKSQITEKALASHQETQLVAADFLQWILEIQEKRDYDEVLSKAGKLGSELSTPQGKKGVQECISLISQAKGVFDTASENATQLKNGQLFSYTQRGVKEEYSYKVKGSVKGEITVAMEGGGTMTIEVNQLDTSSVLRLYNLNLPHQSESDKEYSVGLFLLFDGEYQQAQQHLDKAKNLGAQIDDKISNLMRALKKGKNLRKH